MHMSKKLVAVCAAATVAAVAGGVAAASIPDSGGVIHACYLRNTGALRIADTATCSSKETALSWNQVGPAGFSTAYIARSSSAHALGTTAVTVVTRNLPAGLYAVFAKVNIQSFDNSPQNYDCSLSTGEEAYTRIPGFDGNDWYNQVLVLQDLLTLNAAGSVSMTCTGFNGQADDAKITAIKVGALDG